MKKITLITALAALIACTQSKNYDATGNFIADEVIVSAQQSGQLISYNVQEGQTLTEGQKVGQINTEVLQLQKQQVEATIATLKNKTLNPDDQAALIRSQYEVQKAQLEQQQHELSRVKQLVAGGAATQKQLDDLTAAVSQLQKQLAVTQNQLKASLNNINTQNNSILSQEVPLQKNAEAVQAQINQGEIINPTTGTVLVNYALKGEIQTYGKPLYKIANTDTLTIANGANGGTTNSVLTNDSLNGHLNPSTSSVTLTWLTVPAGVQTHTDGTLTVPAGTASGNFTVHYSICAKH